MKRLFLTTVAMLSLSFGLGGQTVLTDSCGMPDSLRQQSHAMRYNGKTLGVLGGLGPAASADFMRLLVVKAPATTDPEPALRSGLQLLYD